MKVKRNVVKSIHGVSVLLLFLLAIGCAQIEAYEVIPLILIVLIVSTISVVNLGKIEKYEAAEEEKQSDLFSE